MEADSVLRVFGRVDRKSDTGRQGPRCRCRLSMSVSVHQLATGRASFQSAEVLTLFVLCRAFTASKTIALDEGRRMD